jgi:hypothetical protein
VERFYEGEFDDTKTDAGCRSIPLDSFGILRCFGCMTPDNMGHANVDVTKNVYNRTWWEASDGYRKAKNA